MQLSAVEGRVIGSLIEKQLTTPQQYPLTLNALVLACNQSSNRDPVVAYEVAVVESALASLKESKLLRFVHPSHGRSVIRYRQVLEERLGLDERGLSLMGVLLLRGPQTAAELRARTERMADFGGPSGADAELERMTEGDEPLVVRLARRPGQKEERWAQLIAEEPPAWAETRSGEPVRHPVGPRTPAPGLAPAEPDPESRDGAIGHDPAGSGSGAGAPGDRTAEVRGLVAAAPGPAPSAGGADLRAEVTALRREVTQLHTEVDGLRAEVTALRVALDELRVQLGG